MSELEQKLQRLIADESGVKPEEVTLGWIREQRERLYRDPNHRWIGIPPYLQARNLSQVEAEAEEADRFLEDIQSKAANRGTKRESLLSRISKLFS